MKNTKSILGSIVLTALLFSSISAEANSNYSNKVVKNEEKAKARVSSNFMPAPSAEEAPEFPTQRAYGFLEKYSPEQLNKLIGIWPVKVEAENSEKQIKNEISVVETTSDKYSPEQLANILGLTF